MGDSAHICVELIGKKTPSVVCEDVQGNQAKQQSLQNMKRGLFVFRGRCLAVLQII